MPSSLTEFGGLRIVNFDDEFTADPATTMPRISVEYDDPTDALPQALERLLSLPVASRLRGLSVGMWGEPYEQSSGPIAAALAAAAPRLPNLTVLAFADMGFEECEISWIINSDLGAMLNAFPRLHHLHVKGGNNLGLTGLNLPELRTLIVETGGLDSAVVQQLLDAKLPELTHLELYTGDENYGATVTIADLAPIISGHTFKKLTYLGLKNSEIQDEIAAAIAQSPLLNQLEVLDLSLGLLTDVGGQALLDAPGVRNLKHLDLEHNWLSDKVSLKLRQLGISINLDRGAAMDQDDYRYVAIGE